MLGLQMAFDMTGDPAFPERGAFESAKELGPGGHHACRGMGGDERLRHTAHVRQRVHDRASHLRACGNAVPGLLPRIAASGAYASVSTESEQSAGQGYPPTWLLRRHRIPISLSMDTSVWWSGDLFSAMRATLSADRSREHLEAHAKAETIVHSTLRAEEVVRWATVGGAEAIGMGNVIGSLAVGKKADVVLIKNDDSPAMFPILQPFGHVVYQAGRGDVHTVMVNGRIVKFEHRLVGIDLAAAKSAVTRTVEYAQRELGPTEWIDAMAPELPAVELIPNPYTYTDWNAGRSATKHSVNS